MGSQNLIRRIFISEPLPSCLIYNIKMPKVIILPVVLCECVNLIGHAEGSMCWI